LNIAISDFVAVRKQILFKRSEGSPLTHMQSAEGSIASLVKTRESHRNDVVKRRLTLKKSRSIRAPPHLSLRAASIMPIKFKASSGRGPSDPFFMIAVHESSA
jgi:hypothetical protein